MSNDEIEERSYEGCHGSKVFAQDLDLFLGDVFAMNAVSDEIDETESSRFASCVWGHPGIGKTAKIKQFAKTPVTWKGKDYDGYKVHDVPIGQFEEMGDLHGMPEKHAFMKKEEKGFKCEKDYEEAQEKWVAMPLLSQYEAQGWVTDTSKGTKTLYLPPDWVPTEEGPSILLFDDWNRASIRIVKGIMQLFQNYGLLSWKLPKGCNIVLTGNPDEQDYLVTTIDDAILTRIKSVTLKEDAKEWAMWAQGQEDIDSRGINFILRYPEMIVGPSRTNPRTLSEFFRALKHIGSLDTTESKKRMNMQAEALLDEDTISTMMTFFSRDIELIIEPEQIIAGDKKALEHLKTLTGKKEPRIDIIGIMCERLYGYIVKFTGTPTKEQIENFQRFITDKAIPDDLRHGICRRIARNKANSNTKQWLIGNKILRDLILETLH
ncbi:hypothetical protein DRO61_07825 [Candidatus Bathyarchaeota archaeon]|nr:MAG: hypothetical protein DRO61_07825 [Candidatus Bathyarchaeota archaeon]